MAKILLFILLLIIKADDSYKVFDLSKNIKDIEIETGISKTYYLEYQATTNFIFNIKNDSDIQINIVSVNCKLEVEPEEGIINNNNLELLYLKINSSNNIISITPLIDIEDGVFKENYKLKYCPIILNSYYISNSTQQILKIENKEDNFLFFNTSIYNDTFHITYDVKKISKNSFISLNFRFDETPFSIDIKYRNSIEENSKTKNINESTFILLDSDFLLYEVDDKGILNIDIKNINSANTYIFFKIIEENNICLLVKNKINYGFLTSKSVYQYYHAEVLPGEEGELMLHNKRLYGVLYGKIIDKSSVDKYDLNNNPSIYPNKNTNETELLNFDQHKLQLKFNYKNTLHCTNGCYILITYEQSISKDDFPLIGYEYTILSRTWNYTNSFSNIIDLSYNEYFIGCFGQGSSPIHYYSIYLPIDAEKIIIQLEGNYIEAFYEGGRKKINTINPTEKVHKLEMNDNKNVYNLNKTNFTEDVLSFAFKPKNFFSNIFSYYYFRVLYTKKNQVKFLPVDSNFGNLCLPEVNYTSGNYYCHLILKNDYNELKNKFAIASSNQNEYVEIQVLGKCKNGTTINPQTYYLNYIYDEIIDELDFLLFEFIFSNNETKNIISSFSDRFEKIYPQVYSSQMFYLNNFAKICNFNLQNYYLYYQFISGNQGIFNISIPYYDYIDITQNARGLPITISLDNEKFDKFSFNTTHEEHIFYFQLIYNMKSRGIEEIKEREPLTQLLKEIIFPLYYYIKIKGKDYIRMDVNLRLKNYVTSEINNRYIINGYILDSDTIKRIINGEYIELKEPIEGNYTKALAFGLLQINQEIDNNNDDKYLLIKILNLDKNYLNTGSYSIFEILAKEYDKNVSYYLPINKYILETFDDKYNNLRNCNDYTILNTLGNENQTLIELSAEYEDIKIEFENRSIKYDLIKESGFTKYLLNNSDYELLNFSIKNSHNTKTNYMIRYSLFNINKTNSFNFDNHYILNDSYPNNDTVDISLTFNCIILNSSSELLLTKGIYFAITGSLYESEETKENGTNTNYILNKNNSPYVNRTNSSYSYTNRNNWTLLFRNLPRKNCTYNLHLQINAILRDNILNEEFLTYIIKVELTKIKPKEYKDNNKLILLYIIIPIVFIISVVVLFIIIKYLKLKKKNDNLQQEMQVLKFSNDIQSNVLIKEKQISKKESDFETTFI